MALATDPLQVGKEAVDIIKDLGDAAKTLKELTEGMKQFTKIGGLLTKMSFASPAFAAVGALIGIISLFTGGGDPVLEKLDEISSDIENMRQDMDRQFKELAKYIDFSRCIQAMDDAENAVFTSQDFMMKYKRAIGTSSEKFWRQEFLNTVNNVALNSHVNKLFAFTGENGNSMASCNFLELTYQGNVNTGFYKSSINGVASIGTYILSLQAIAVSVYSGYIETTYPDT
jgi:hypothetical protein